MSPEEQLSPIIDLCDHAQLVDETGRKVVFLPSMTFQVGKGEATQDLLFVPFRHSGYDSRLFFAEQLGGNLAVNWTQHHLLGRVWWAPSFKVNTSLTWRDQILQHIKVVA
jgi:hypothetical protein